MADDNPHMSAYLAWLKQHRGATDETIRRYRTDIRRLMPMLGEPAQWDAAGLRSAFQRRSKETPGSASLLVTIMRSYIRFLVVRGECRPALLHAVPSVQRYRLSTLPRHVDPATIERIIAACPTDRPVEVRDKAIILLLARLGLGPIGLCRSLGKLQAIDRIGIVGEVPWQIVDPVVDFDVALIFQEPDEAPDPCCLVSLVVRLLRRIPVAPAPMLLEPPDSPIVNRADRGPMPLQPKQEMADRRAIQNRTA
ncbi:hypothetical protein I6F66_20640 [Pseudoalteromonas sp. NZS100_1]|nr:hypothetical protein [Pseudoalteromonas sp. NZS100_1]